MSRTSTINETASTTVIADFVFLSFTIEVAEKIYKKGTENVANKIKQISKPCETS